MALIDWDYRFKHRGRSYKLFKRVDSKDANYYIHVQRSKKRHKQSLETNLRETAIDRAKKFINDVLDENWDAVQAVKVKHRVSNLQQVMDIYEKTAGIDPHSIKNNKLAMRKVLERIQGERRDPKDISLNLLTKQLAIAFQDWMLAHYTEKAEKDAPSQRAARDLALRTSKSTLNQARSLFSRRPDNNMMERYEVAGLVLPASIEDFLTCRLRGRIEKDEYNQPSDALVKTAFDDIEKLKHRDTNVYVGFWHAVGAGLRRKEIRHCDWSYWIERDGMWWISGGLGKDGRRIEVPIQSRAVTALAQFRKDKGPVIVGEKLEWAKRLNTWMRFQGWETEKKLHELRAYVGSLIYRKNPEAARRFMRHKTLKQTQTFYVRYGAEAAPVDVL